MRQREGLLAAAELIRPAEGRDGVPPGRSGACGPGGGFYGLAAGMIKISTLRHDGREAILAVLEPGNWFGEITA